VKRNYQDELLIHQTAAQHFELGATAALGAVLIPHAASEEPQAVLGRIRLVTEESGPNVVGLRIKCGDKEIIVAAKTDLRRDMVREDRRPKYTYDSGRISFGGFETNGDLIFGRLEGSTLHYTIVNLTKAVYFGQTLVEAQPTMFGLAFDAGRDRGDTGKLRYWRDSAVIRGR